MATALAPGTRLYNPSPFANGQVVKNANGTVVDAAQPGFRNPNGTPNALGTVLPQFDAWTQSQFGKAYEDTSGLSDAQNATRLAKWQELMGAANAPPTPASPTPAPTAPATPTPSPTGVTPLSSLTPTTASATRAFMPSAMPSLSLGPTASPAAPTDVGGTGSTTAPTPIGDASPFTGAFSPRQPTPTPGGTGTITPSGFTPRQPTPTPNPNPNAPVTYPTYTDTYAATTNFGPTSDLRSTQISPTNSAQTQQAADAATTALGTYTSFQASPFTSVASGAYTPASDTGAARSLLSTTLNGITSGPTRSQLATQQLALNNELNDQSFNQEQRAVGQNAAKFGRIGSGLTTNDLTGVVQSHDKVREQNSRQAALDAASGEISDRLNNLNAVSGVTSLLGGEDRSNAGINLTLRNEARAEGDRQSAFDTTDFNRRSQLFGDTANYQTNRENQDAALRSELRGERTYQTGQEQTAYDRNRQGILDGQNQTNTALSQGLALLAAGNGSDPSGILTQVGLSNAANAQSGYSDIGNLISRWLASQKKS